MENTEEAQIEEPVEAQAENMEVAPVEEPVEAEIEKKEVAAVEAPVEKPGESSPRTINKYDWTSHQVDEVLVTPS